MGQSGMTTIVHEGGAFRSSHFEQLTGRPLSRSLEWSLPGLWEVAMQMASWAFWDIQVDDGGTSFAPPTKQSTSTWPRMICDKLDLGK